MHMADALISPAVGGTMWVATAATAVYCAKKVREENDPAKIPLMGVLGAFIFAAQMLNFTIPGTGSSGHLGGGLILAILLGPEAAFLMIASVLTVQAFFFADGGLLALGCNIFNLGFFPAFVGYPIFKMIVKDKWTHRTGHRGQHRRSRGRPAAWRDGVVVQTALSGISALPFTTFVLMMLPIHRSDRPRRGLCDRRCRALCHGRRSPRCCRAQPRGSRWPGVKLKTVLIGLGIAAVVQASRSRGSRRPTPMGWSGRSRGSLAARSSPERPPSRCRTPLRPSRKVRRFCPTTHSSRRSAGEWKRGPPLSGPRSMPAQARRDSSVRASRSLLAGIIGFALDRRRHSGTPPSDGTAAWTRQRRGLCVNQQRGPPIGRASRATDGGGAGLSTA